MGNWYTPDGWIAASALLVVGAGLVVEGEGVTWVVGAFEDVGAGVVGAGVVGSGVEGAGVLGTCIVGAGVEATGDGVAWAMVGATPLVEGVGGDADEDGVGWDDPIGGETTTTTAGEGEGDACVAVNASVRDSVAENVLGSNRVGCSKPISSSAARRWRPPRMKPTSLSALAKEV